MDGEGSTLRLKLLTALTASAVEDTNGTGATVTVIHAYGLK